MDIGGALSAALIDYLSVEDLVGFRRGYASFDNCCAYRTRSTPRTSAWPARRAAWVEHRAAQVSPVLADLRDEGVSERRGTERRVGFEVGLDFKQILDDLNVRRNTWWGYGLHVVFDNIRIP